MEHESFACFVCVLSSVSTVCERRLSHLSERNSDAWRDAAARFSGDFLIDRGHVHTHAHDSFQRNWAMGVFDARLDFGSHRYHAEDDLL